MTDKTQNNVPQPPTGFRKAVSGGSQLYINGVLEASTALTSIGGGVGTLPLHWGQAPGAGGAGPDTQFHGYMDDIYFADVALSQAEIMAFVSPEPTTVALLGLGGLLAFRRRLKK